ncbi:transporter [Methylopila sp. 73B]|uniref:transporter n=1 Tax=Methylopila sp. 73B TaxID=1120792 RepID=UPI000365C923|nr:transporter [Methylopila sp. 73B]
MLAAACRAWGIAALVLAMNAATPAKAVDLNSMDYMPAPAGTTVALSYTTFTSRGSYKALGGPRFKKDTSLDSMTEILRLVHYMDIGGITVAPQVLLPFGALYDGKIGGAKFESTQGLADPILAAPVWLLNDTRSGSFFAITPYLFLPLGSYDAGEALNLGENRWKFDLQAGYQQNFADFSLQIAGDVMWYGDNKDAISRGSGRLEQKETYQAQAWLSYSPPADKTWRFAVGYSKYWGGKQELNGVENGSATRADQVRLEISKFVRPDFQILGLVQHDVAGSGGFKEDFRGQIRLMKVF